jgi:murein DD-endopeptidase MepM/ murein hydrolase activator NlpD
VSPSPTTDTHGGSTGDLYRGTYSTERLVAAADVLRQEGWSEEEIRRQVFSPFIVVGAASWSDSWGAPRFGPGSIVRRHEGQDVLCAYGAEVLAAEDGTIEFGTSLLGGRDARLHRPGGGFWYYAHLSEWNLDDFSNGDPVHTGDVIGYCGESGNATVPHVHFGHYGPDGEAIDPMGSLVSWLREAESDLGDLLGDTLVPVPQATTLPPSMPIDTPISLVSLGGVEGDSPGVIDESAVVPHAFVRAEGRDGAFELTLIWIAAISCAWVSRLFGRLVVARSKRTRKP